GLVDVDVIEAVVKTGPKAVEATFAEWNAPKAGKPFGSDKNGPTATVHTPVFRLRNLTARPVWHLQYVLFEYDAQGKLVAGPMGPQGIDVSLKVGEAREVSLGALEVTDASRTLEIEIASVVYSDFAAEVYPPPLRAVPAQWWKVDVPRPK